MSEAAAAAAAVPPGDVGNGGKEKPPTPWFLYFVVFLLIVLVVLIALYCVALNDPNFPTRRHRGPNLVNSQGGPPSWMNSALRSRPVTGAKAQPHEIPFALHRQAKFPKPSKIIRPNAENASVAAPPPPPPPVAAAAAAVASAVDASGGGELRAAVSMIPNMIRSSLLGFAPKLLSALKSTPNAELGEETKNSSDGISEETRHTTYGHGDAPPYVSGVELVDGSILRISGANFDENAAVAFLGLTNECTCQVMSTSRIDCHCDKPDKSILARLRAMVINPDSQSFSWDDPANKSYYLSFTSPGIPKQAVVGQTLTVGVGLFANGVLELFPSASISIWLEVILRPQPPSSSSSSSSSSDSDTESNTANEEQVIKELWVEIARGKAEFHNIAMPAAGTYVLRATAVQKQPNGRKQIVAPIIESLPIQTKE